MSFVAIVTPTTEVVFVFFFPLIVQFFGFCFSSYCDIVTSLLRVGAPAHYKVKMQHKNYLKELNVVT